VTWPGHLTRRKPFWACVTSFPAFSQERRPFFSPPHEKLTTEKNTYYEKRGKYKALTTLTNWKLLCAISTTVKGMGLLACFVYKRAKIFANIKEIFFKSTREPITFEFMHYFSFFSMFVLHIFIYHLFIYHNLPPFSQCTATENLHFCILNFL
jgi:hypothetical protein